MPIEELIFVPKNAQYYAALGAVLYGLHEAEDVGVLTGLEALREYITTGPQGAPRRDRGPAAVEDERRARGLQANVRDPEVRAGDVRRRARSFARVIGLDGGSTSSKAVLVDYESGRILAKAYQLSKGNPIQDTKELLEEAPRLRRGRPEGEARGHGLRRDRLRGRRARAVRA